MTATAPVTPAARLIKRFGAKRIADWTGRHRGRVHAWAWPTSRGGTGGVVPVRLRAKIIAGAQRELRETVTPAEFELQAGEAYLLDEVAA